MIVRIDRGIMCRCGRHVDTDDWKCGASNNKPNQLALGTRTVLLLLHVVEWNNVGPRVPWCGYEVPVCYHVPLGRI